MSNDELKSKLDDLARRMDDATTAEEAEALMYELGELAPPVEVEQIEQMAMIADAAADAVLDELLYTASALKTEWVPVQALQMLKDSPYIFTQKIWATVDKFGIKVETHVPDDLSELDDL